MAAFILGVAVGAAAVLVVLSVCMWVAVVRFEGSE